LDYSLVTTVSQSPILKLICGSQTARITGHRPHFIRKRRYKKKQLTLIKILAHLDQD
jgi:hypothetical protein